MQIEIPIVFDGYNPTLQFLRTDKSIRVVIDTSLDQYDKIKDIPKLPNGIYRITIESAVRENAGRGGEDSE